MKRFSKEKMAGMAGTLLVHAAVAALLYFLVLTPPAKLPEKGVEVMMGVDIENFGPRTGRTRRSQPCRFCR